MKDKIEKDAKLSKDRQRVIMVVSFITLAIGIIYLISRLVGGAFYDFWSSAMPYLLIGMGAILAIMLENLKGDESVKDGRTVKDNRTVKDDKTVK